jgi:hypothetical protein
LNAARNAKWLIRKSGAGRPFSDASGATSKRGLAANIGPKAGEPSYHFSLVSRFQLLGDWVDIKLYTWQQSIQQNIALQDFLTFYHGYIVAG